MGRLELSHITKVFSEGKTERKVLRDLSFTVDEGEFVSMLAGYVGVPDAPLD